MKKFAILPILFLAAPALADNFKLTSPDVKDGGKLADKQVFNSFGCTGGNVSPGLAWSNPPAGTKSFALMVHDPDAPTGGSGWWHWVVYNIPASATSIPAGGPLPKGAVEGKTDFGKPGWGGPCPPAGSPDHHYNFTLYALKVDKLDIPADASAAFVGYNVVGASLGSAKLTAVYSRK